jgi:hypothetical protein
VACSSEEPQLEQVRPEDVARARELPFLSRPTMRSLTHAEYQAEREAERDKASSESGRDSLEWLKATAGRLGFFPPGYDLTTALSEQTRYVAGQYSPKTKVITLIKEVETNPIVLTHELVHVLQDQHFDLQSVDDGGSRTTDEFYARRAVIEGDATVAAYRHVWRSDPSALPSIFWKRDQQKLSEDTFSLQPDLPRFFLAYASFVYPYGASFVATKIGLFEEGGRNPRFKFAAIDQMFRDGKLPETTQQIINGGIEADSGSSDDFVKDVGLTGLPHTLLSRYEVASVDRLGTYFIRLLGQMLHHPKVSTTTEWNGDQLVFLRPFVSSSMKKRIDQPPTAVVWTTAWKTEDAATSFYRYLRDLQAREHEPAPNTQRYIANDGELMWIERSEKRVVLIKNVEPPEAMEELARQALKVGRFDSTLAVKHPMHLSLARHQ